jgi:polypeptide N-acetylgalactosaminyltransferase
VVVLLDSHIEVQPGWLPPLLTRIDEDRTRIVMPHIDSISPTTLATSAGGIGVLGFMWNMQEHGIPPLYKDIVMRGADNTAPLRTPVISGGAMAFNKQYFLSLGGFDEGMGYWGGEALELSFRVWQCGGKLELVHCSRVR